MLEKLVLQIASLSSEDKAWLMSRLSEADRRKLTVLVNEAIDIELSSNSSIKENNSESNDKETAAFNHSLSDDDLGRLPEFWRMFIKNQHQDNYRNEELPSELRKSVLNNARQMIPNNINNFEI